MKIVTFVVLFCTLQNTVLSGRTFFHIVEDFTSYIINFHNVLAKETHYLVNVEDGKVQMSDYQSNVTLISLTFERKIMWVYESIENAVRQIILDTGMSDHEDLIEHCQDSRNSDYNKMLDIAWANQKVCKQIGKEGADQLEEILKEISGRQPSMHIKLDEIIPDCIARSATNSQLVSCLIENLYGKMAPEMAQLMKRMWDDVATMSADVTEKLKGIERCFIIISNEMEAKMNNIVNGFRACCVAASPGAY